MASVSDEDGLVIQGKSRKEGITLHLDKLQKGEFNIGRRYTNSATYTDRQGKNYETSADGHGLVTITRIDEENRTLDGKFYFTAIIPNKDTVFVSQGVLYNVSYAGGKIGDEGNAGTFSAKVDNQKFEAMSVSATKLGDDIVITALTTTSTITITVPKDVAIGDFTLPTSGFEMLLLDINGPHPAISGSISIKEHNTTNRSLKATFKFETEENIVTDGKFEVTYN